MIDETRPCGWIGGVFRQRNSCSRSNKLVDGDAGASLRSIYAGIGQELPGPLDETFDSELASNAS